MQETENPTFCYRVVGTLRLGKFENFLRGKDEVSLGIYTHFARQFYVVVCVLNV